ncbi:MAG: UGSC family (seleno)protein, partial [Bilophila wadsworthia]
TFKFTGTYADVNKLFAKRKWSLSLPIIPPTVDRVREMLKGTKRAPSEVLWVVPPRQGMLTVELVAVLGVMAGAQPEHMPLLLATIDAMKAPEAAWRGTSTTTAPTSPLIVISGPIVEKLKLNAGTGTAGGENPVTNALGYFVNLVGDVVGGSVPPNLRSTRAPSTSWPTSRKTPRKPVERPTPRAGFTRDDSVVTSRLPRQRQHRS